MFQIITVPDEKLRLVSQPIKSVDKKLTNFIKELGDTLINKADPPGVGVSAIQVGKPLRVFFTLLPKTDYRKEGAWNKSNLELKAYINPKITHKSKEITLGDDPKKPVMEGCLSIPHIWGPVWRHSQIDLSYQSIDSGKLVSQQSSFSDFPARVIQHEYDHLEGILFTDYYQNTSPSSNFKNLGKIDQIFFDEGDKFIPIEFPEKILTW